MMAERLGERPRSERRRCYLFGGLDQLGREKNDDREECGAPFRELRLGYLPGGIVHSAGTQMSGGAKIERGRHFGRASFVSAPPDSTSRAGITPRERRNSATGRLGSYGFAFPSGGNQRTLTEHVERIPTTGEAPCFFSG